MEEPVLEYTPCTIAPDKLEAVFQKEYKTTKRDAGFESLLLEKNPEPLEEEKVVEIIEASKDGNVLSLNTLLKDQTSEHFLESIPTAETSKAINPTFKKPEVKTELEVIFAKINMNRTKIKYLKAQFSMLDTFYDECVKSVKDLSPQLLTKLEINDAAAVNKKINITPTPVDNLLNDMPCKLGEIKFLMEVLREHERNKARM